MFSISTFCLYSFNILKAKCWTCLTKCWVNSTKILNTFVADNWAKVAFKDECLVYLLKDRYEPHSGFSLHFWPFSISFISHLSISIWVKFTKLRSIAVILSWNFNFLYLQTTYFMLSTLDSVWYAVRLRLERGPICSYDGLKGPLRFLPLVREWMHAR